MVRHRRETVCARVTGIYRHSYIRHVMVTWRESLLDDVCDEGSARIYAARLLTAAVLGPSRDARARSLPGSSRESRLAPLYTVLIPTNNEVRTKAAAAERG